MDADHFVGAALRAAGAECFRESDLANQARLPSSVFHHGVGALLYHVLREKGQLEEWPGRVREVLAQEARREGALEMLRHRELVRVLGALAASGIQPVLMKGAALAYTHYPAPYLRPRADTDILVDRAQAEKAGAALRELGYEPMNTVRGRFIMYQQAYTRAEGRSVRHSCDLHWRICNRQVFADSLSYAELAARAVRVPALGGQARALAPADALLLACVHRVAHHGGCERAIWLYDIHLLATAMSTAEWASFAHIAAEKGLASVCLSGLQAAREWFGAEVPGEVLELWLSNGAGTGTEASAAYLRGKRRRIHDLWSDLQALPSWRQRMRLLREHAFPSPDYMLKRYDVSARLLLPVLYCRRALVGVWKMPRRLGP